MMAYRKISVSIFLLFFLFSCGKEEETKLYFFQSRVIQREICEIGLPEDKDEVREEICRGLRREKILRLTLEVDKEDRARLIGLDMNGGENRKILGTRDNQGGFIFLDKFERENEKTGCKLKRHHLIQLRISKELETTMSSCTALIGRETVWNTTNWQCEEFGEGKMRTSRLRWEEDPTCED